MKRNMLDSWSRKKIHQKVNQIQIEQNKEKAYIEKQLLLLDSKMDKLLVALEELKNFSDEKYSFQRADISQLQELMKVIIANDLLKPITSELVGEKLIKPELIHENEGENERRSNEYVISPNYYD